MSNGPKVQNIPIRTTEGRRVREAFVEPVDADYSEIELRILAHMSGDPVKLQALYEEVASSDPHQGGTT